MKRKVFDNNKISVVQAFIRENGYHESIGSAELFTFGDSIGNGTDENHFQVGFTSVDLMSHIETGVVFHCDATYKVVKVGYPLIVFGMSDINRKFFPICFMFTSHEFTEDYKNFFASLIQLSNLLKIVFSPKYICIDASKSMSGAIKKLLPSCVVLMCWFHLKSNVTLKTSINLIN